MLDTRYIHLHEALGLGAMWLKNSAKIIAPQSNPTQKNTFRQPETPKKHKNKHSASRQELISFLQKSTPTQTDTPTQQPIQTNQPNHRFTIALKPARLLALSACPTWQDISANRLFSGEDGALLQRMFAAINLPSEQVQLSCWIKNMPNHHTFPNLGMFAAAIDEIQQEKHITQAQAILLLGDDFKRPAMQPYIQQVAGDTPVFTIPHPLRIHNDPTLRKPVWLILQQLQAHLQQTESHV